MLFCGSYSYLKENLKNIVSNIDKKESLVFIVYTNQMKTYLKEYLVKELGMLVNSRFYTLIDISKELVDIEPLQDFDKNLILKKVLFDKNLQLEGLPEQYNTIIEQIKRYKIKDIKSLFLKEIYEKYEEIKGDEYFDREDIQKIACEKQTNLRIDNLFVIGIKSLQPLHKDLFRKIRQISENFYVFLPFVKESGYFQHYEHFSDSIEFFESLTTTKNEESTEDKNIQITKLIYNFDYNLKPIKNENIHIIKAQNQYKEVEYIAQKISKLAVEKDVKYYKIGVVIPQIQSYLPFIKEIFKKYKIPYYLLEENKYIDHILYKKLFSIFEIRQKNFSKTAVLNVLSDKLLNIQNQLDLEEKILLSPISEGFSEWEEIFFMDKGNEDLKHFLSVLNEIPKKANISTYIQYFKEINNKFVKHQTGKDFLENILTSLEKVKLYSTLFYEIDYDEFVSIVRTFFYQENPENKTKSNTVSIVSPTSAEGNNFDYIFFLNLNSGDFPEISKEELVIYHLNENNLDYPYHLLMQQLLSFSTIFDKDKTIYLSYITNSIYSAQKAPSIFIEEVKRVLNKEEIKPHIDTATYKDFIVEYAENLKIVKENLNTKFEKYKSLLNLTKNDFQFNQVEVKYPISPTKFSVYSYCPYKFFLEYIIGIQEFKEPDRTEISPLEKGVLVHSLLEEFYKETGIYINENLKEQKLKQLEDKFNTKINQLMQFVFPSYRPFEYEKAKSLLERLKIFIQQDLNRLKEQNKKVEILEQEISDEIFTGRIDRVDKDTAGYYYIYDYKTGEIPVKKESLKEEIKTKYIQLVIYKKLLEQKNKKVKEIGILAVNDKEKEFIYKIDNFDDFKELEQHLEELITNIKNKNFYPQENELCTYCQFNEFCVKKVE